MLLGLFTGIINGLFGAGGGTLLVPAMEKFLKVETHKAHATALAVILPLTLVSIVVYQGANKVDWLTVLYVSIGGVVGGYIGAKLLNKCSSGLLHKLFGAAMVIAAVRMIL